MKDMDQVRVLAEMDGVQVDKDRAGKGRDSADLRET